MPCLSLWACMLLCMLPPCVRTPSLGVSIFQQHCNDQLPVNGLQQLSRGCSQQAPPTVLLHPFSRHANSCTAACAHKPPLLPVCSSSRHIRRLTHLLDLDGRPYMRTRVDHTSTYVLPPSFLPALVGLHCWGGDLSHAHAHTMARRAQELRSTVAAVVLLLALASGAPGRRDWWGAQCCGEARSR